MLSDLFSGTVCDKQIEALNNAIVHARERNVAGAENEINQLVGRIAYYTNEKAQLAASGARILTDPLMKAFFDQWRAIAEKLTSIPTVDTTLSEEMDQCHKLMYDTAHLAIAVFTGFPAQKCPQDLVLRRSKASRVHHDGEKLFAFLCEVYLMICACPPPPMLDSFQLDEARGIGDRVYNTMFGLYRALDDKRKHEKFQLGKGTRKNR